MDEDKQTTEQATDTDKGTEVNEAPTLESLMSRISAMEADVEKYKSDAEKYKNLMRKQEERAKKTHEELEKTKGDMPDVDQIIAEAEARGRQAATEEKDGELAKLRVKVEAVRLGVPDEVLELADSSKLIKDGEVNTEALKALAIASGNSSFEAGAADLGIGASNKGHSPVEEMDPAKLAEMVNKISPFG